MQQSKDYKNYFTQLEEGLPDHRDNRGKRHNLWFVCTCSIIAVMNGRVTPSAIQRYIKNRFEDLCIAIEYEAHAPISCSQFWRIFGELDWASWNAVNESFFGITIEQQEDESADQTWKAADGKELRGSIEAGDKRGTNVVRVVEHGSGRVLAQSYYDGSKESEKNVVRDFASKQLKGEKVTMDALHSDPNTLELIHENEGKYIVQLKDNQRNTKEELEAVPRYLPLKDEVETNDIGHGRAETRHYKFYDLNDPLFEDCLDERWRDCGIQTLIKVHRKFTYKKTGKVEQQTSLYISNDTYRELVQAEVVLIGSSTLRGQYVKSRELANAIRQHWEIESDHQVRDVTFKEDALKSKVKNMQKTMAVCLSAVVMLFREISVTNCKAATEKFSDLPYLFFDRLKKINFL